MNANKGSCHLLVLVTTSGIALETPLEKRIWAWWPATRRN